MASTILAVVAPSFTDPSNYELSNVSVPTATNPDDVVIAIHAASINPVDVKLASGAFKMILSESFPLRIGYDCAGVVTDVGSSVKSIKVGDEVWSRLPEASKGSWAEKVVCAEHYVSLKPQSLSFADAASLPLAALTAMQALNKYDGSLAGKTVFIPAGLGGTGAFACQLAKNVFKAGKVITTLSTKKIPLVAEHLGEGTVDQIIDYTKEDPAKVIPKGSIDFMFDTMGQAMSYLSLMKPNTGTIVSISTTPSASTFKNSSFFKRPNKPQMPFIAGLLLDSLDTIRQARARRWKVNYSYMFLSSDAEQLDTLRELVEEKKIRPVVGSSTDLRDIEAVRKECSMVYNGKGGLGKSVFIVVKDL